MGSSQESPDQIISRLEGQVSDYEKEITELNKIGDDAKELRFNSLLSEMQNADALVENHSRLSLVLSTGLLAFATTESVVSVPRGGASLLRGCCSFNLVYKNKPA